MANGQEPGDPAKLAQALIIISTEEKPPRFLAGTDAVGTAEQVAATLQERPMHIVNCQVQWHLMK